MGLFSSIVGAVAPTILGRVFGSKDKPSDIGQAVGAGIGGALENRQRQENAAAANAFSERLSNTSYQRAVNDLRAAGINPMLVTKMGGASTPVGQMAGVTPATVPAGQLQNSARQVNAQAELANRTAEKIIEETKNIPYEGLRIQEMIIKIRNELKFIEAQTYSEYEKRDVLAQTIDKIRNEAKISDFELKAIEAIDNMGKEAKQFKPVMDILINFMNARR